MAYLLHWLGRLPTSAMRAAAIGVAIACAVPVHAQNPKVYRVAHISMTSPQSELTGNDPIQPAMRAFVHRLRDRGYIQGRNLILDIRSLEGNLERAEQVAADLVRLRPDVIYIAAQPVVARSLKVTAGVPIVMIAGAGVVESGLVRSLARPGGTITGVLVDVDAAVEAKRLELLREIMPKVRRVTYLGPQTSWDTPAGEHVRATAQRLGLNLSHVGKGHTGADYDAAFALIERERPDAIFLPLDGTTYAHRQKIGQFVVANRIACTSGFSVIVEHGCLMSYSVDTKDLLRRVADYVAMILEGAKPSDMPIEQPRTFELVINSRTAKMLGLAIPPSILLRADSVIE